MVYLKNVVTLHFSPERCIGCGMCLEVCPHAVWALNSGGANIADRDACMECGACARNCAPGAIEVKAGVGCAAAVINSALGRKKACCVAPKPSGECADSAPSGTECC